MIMILPEVDLHRQYIQTNGVPLLREYCKGSCCINHFVEVEDACDESGYHIASAGVVMDTEAGRERDYMSRKSQLSFRMTQVIVIIFLYPRHI